MSYEFRLAAAFIHPVAEYELAGGSQGSSSCACGKAIKNIFMVQHPSGHSVELGSECINNYAELEHVRKSVEAKRKADKEVARIEEEARLNTEYAALRQEYAALRSRITNRMAYTRVDRDLYLIATGRNVSGSYTVKRIKNKIAKQSVFNEYIKQVMHGAKFQDVGDKAEDYVKSMV